MCERRAEQALESDSEREREEERERERERANSNRVPAYVHSVPGAWRLAPIMKLVSSSLYVFDVALKLLIDQMEFVDQLFTVLFNENTDETVTLAYIDKNKIELKHLERTNPIICYVL